MSLLAVSNLVLWAVVIALAVTVLALARQIGVLHERIAPVGALATGEGPKPGEAAPRVRTRLLDGSDFTIAARGVAELLLFVSADCLVCKRVIPLAVSVSRAEGVDLVLVGDGAAAELNALVDRFGLQGRPFVNGPEAGMAFAVGKVPFGVLVDTSGRISAKGLVNTREHLESLLTAGRTGFASVQDFAAARAARRVETRDG